MPGRASGEVMLALTHQEAKTKEKEQANYSNLIRTNPFCHPEALLLGIWALEEPGLGIAGWKELLKIGPPLNGSPKKPVLRSQYPLHA
jgi:hypothetical protein